MAHHFIYLPAETERGKDRDERLRAVGLGNHASGCDTMQLHEGPDGGSGLLLGWLTPREKTFAYRPDEQVWRRSAASGDVEAGAYHVGVWKSRPPKEDELRLPYMHRGAHVRLAGDLWKIPRPQAIEQTAKLQDDGSLRFIPQREMEWYVHDCDKRLAALQHTANEDGTSTVRWSYTNEELWQWLCRVLAINYRVTPELISYLDLLTTKTMPELYMTALGIEGAADNG